ncbi:MAG: class I SAM-dependent methyltransferase [Deltaproteobacteria bacterium]|nr:class I SAM-dependent methyltransferase [Deltaproteobacteria bacterium]
MFSYVFMKMLEMRPTSYDRQMELASRGGIRAVKIEVANEIPAKSHVLEIGCGTGELAEMMIKRGATVYGFDFNPNMVEVAVKRIESSGLKGKLSVHHMAVDGMDTLPDAAFDAAVSTLTFSELNDDERRFALKHAQRVLKPGGRLIIADEVIPEKFSKRLFHKLIRAPMVAVTYLVSKATTRPITDLAGEIAKAGFTVQKETRTHSDAFAIVVATSANQRRTW